MVQVVTIRSRRLYGQSNIFSSLPQLIRVKEIKKTIPARVEFEINLRPRHVGKEKVPLNLLLIPAIQTLPSEPSTANIAARDRRWWLRSLTVTSCPSSHHDHENLPPARRVAMDAHSGYGGRHGKGQPQHQCSDLAYDDFSDDPSLDESNRASVLPDRQSTPCSLDDTVEFWSSRDTDLPMYRVSATPKVEISSYCFG
jgi:hypothetical protein